MMKNENVRTLLENSHDAIKIDVMPRYNNDKLEDVKTFLFLGELFIMKTVFCTSYLMT